MRAVAAAHRHPEPLAPDGDGTRTPLVLANGIGASLEVPELS